ncbi:hypothetical protein Rrhod_1441 [Rhodococcus rhodnii LMG 5362]|uniref:Uncharacterized protein n=1 Tax=Rhodococcus rhodnii LMG 5362 TaxID=1273125 RepID=R7WPF4_9NOCA|nr:hypothetical protein Rrhod_1441 [Rhodococcus rhodnii LMG 5362]
MQIDQQRHGSRKEIVVFGVLAVTMLLMMLLLVVPGIVG